MYTQTSSHLRHTDQFSHKIRFFLLQFRKLINDDKQVGNRLFRLAALIKPCIEIDVIHSVLGKDPLSAQVFALDRYHCPADLISRKVGYLTCHMRKI